MKDAADSFQPGDRDDAFLRNVGSCNNHMESYTRRRHSVFLRRVLQLLVNANVVPSSPILSTLMTEKIRSSETSVLTRTTGI
jgi:hypothetical protein